MPHTSHLGRPHLPSAKPPSHGSAPRRKLRLGSRGFRCTEAARARSAVPLPPLFPFPFHSPRALFSSRLFSIPCPACLVAYTHVLPFVTPVEWQDERPPAPSYLRILYLGKILQDEDTLSSTSHPSPRADSEPDKLPPPFLPCPSTCSISTFYPTPHLYAVYRTFLSTATAPLTQPYLHEKSRASHT